MRDPDAIMAYEAKQQQLVREIVDTFHQAVEDNYREIFGTIAVTLLQSLTNKRLMSSNKLVQRLYTEACDRISTFLDAEVGKPSASRNNSKLWFAERQYLKLKIFEKVMQSFSSGIVGEYHTQEMSRDYKII